MNAARHILVPGLAFAFAWGALGCDKHPSPVQPSASDVKSVTIEGPISVAPGQTAKFYATAHLSGGALRDVTDEAIWQSSFGSVLTVERGGRATAHQRGETELTAMYQALPATRQIVVLEDGTYRLAGIVSEPKPVGLPVADARVEVTGGAGAGQLSTTTAPDGRYALFGVAGPTELRVTKDGYQPTVIRVTVAEHLTQDIELPLVRPRSDLSGLYTLTVKAANLCAQSLPRDVRSRTYSARVRQSGPDLEVELSGAQFVVLSSGQGDGFRGRVDPGQVTFTVNSYFTYYYWYYSIPDVVEKLPSGFFTFGGTVVTGTQPPLSGKLSGSFQWFTQYPNHAAVPASACQGDHQFTLARIGS
jgi:hypothetical protein